METKSVGYEKNMKLVEHSSEMLSSCQRVMLVLGAVTDLGIRLTAITLRHPQERMSSTGFSSPSSACVVFRSSAAILQQKYELQTDRAPLRRLMCDRVHLLISIRGTALRPPDSIFRLFRQSFP
jgi:hypothetical protein